MNYPYSQHTLRRVASCSGVGLHTGANVLMRVLPAGADSGIVFRRMDVDGGMSERSLVSATYDYVTDTLLGTTIENEHGVAVATVEHLMAAFWGFGVDNAAVEIHGQEVPIMDGSSEPFLALMQKAGLAAQSAARHILVIDDVIRVEEGGAAAELRPYAGFMLDVSIDFAHAAISRQRVAIDFSTQGFADSLGRARTFGFAADVKKLQAAGLARGGSLENAVVIGETGVLNEGGLRFDDEFVRHKALDCLGDYFLAGHRIRGKAVTSRPGHSVNNTLIRTLFKTPSAWHLASAEAAAVEPRIKTRRGETRRKRSHLTGHT